MRVCLTRNAQLHDPDQSGAKPPLEVDWDQSGLDPDSANAHSVWMRSMLIESWVNEHSQPSVDRLLDAQLSHMLCI